MRTIQRRQVRVLLPTKQHLDCAVRLKARGQEVLNSVLQQLGVSELQILALAVLRDNKYLFIDLHQKLSKYFGKRWMRGSLTDPFTLFLRVKYYVESGRLLLSSKVQQLYYAELRRKVLQSQSDQQEALFFQLAASALQAEVGDPEQRDEDEEENKHGHYFLPEDYFPSWLIRRRGRCFLLQHCPSLHLELRGVSRSQAVLRFIKEASSLQDGPVTLYGMRREKKESRDSVLLGATVKGIHIYEEMEGKQSLKYVFSWTDIDCITFQGRKFEISAVGSLCLPKLVFYTSSSFHSKHIFMHLRDSHRFHISTRDAVSCIQQLEDMEACQSHKEAYICDTKHLKQRLQRLMSSVSDCSVAAETPTSCFQGDEEEEEEEDNFSLWEFEMSVDEPDEFLVDDPAEVSWLAELLRDEPVNEALALPSSYWAAITAEMKQVLRRRADEGLSVD
ncbi:uncharacterized protein V6R79_006573 [Siganus canaliculatus]